MAATRARAAAAAPKVVKEKAPAVKKEAAAAKAPPPPTVVLNSIKPPLTAVGDKILAGRKVVIRHFGQLSVLNTTVRQNLSVAENEAFDAVLVELTLAQRRIMRVAEFREFYDPEKHIAALMGSTAEQVAQFNAEYNLGLTELEQASLLAFNGVRKKLEGKFAPNGKLYPFTTPPVGEKLLRVVGNMVRSTNEEYSMTLKQAEAVWTRCRKVWEDGKRDTNASVQASGYTRPLTIHKDRIEIGCQRATRTQVETLALEQGWVE